MVRTNRRMTSTFARLANWFLCTGVSHTIRVWMCMDRTNRRWERKGKKKKEKKREHNNAQQCERVLTQLLHGDIRHTIRYVVTSLRGKKRLPTWERLLFTYYNFFTLRATIRYIDLYRTYSLSSENEITIDSKKHVTNIFYSDEITRFFILKLSYVYIYVCINFIKSFSLLLLFLHRSYFEFKYSNFSNFRKGMKKKKKKIRFSSEDTRGNVYVSVKQVDKRWEMIGCACIP